MENNKNHNLKKSVITYHMLYRETIYDIPLRSAMFIYYHSWCPYAKKTENIMMMLVFQ